MMTCFLTKGIVKKAFLIFQRNQAVIEEYTSTKKSLEIVIMDRNIDREINNENTRVQKVQRRFLIVDIILMALFSCICKPRSDVIKDWKTQVLFDEADSSQFSGPEEAY